MTTSNFQPKAVSEFLISPQTYNFYIPSFQRGYRWMPKQVEDLLKDLYEYANSDAASDVYYLQPLVVRRMPKPGQNSSEEKECYDWQVLDGQQRLTTLRLIIEEFKGYLPPAIQIKLKDYTLTYMSRPNFDFGNAKPSDNLDSYFVAMARKTISDWMGAHSNNVDDIAKMYSLACTLFGTNKNKSIKFIWYEVEGEDSSDAGAIAIFNRLNRGKIKLTPSELIKALLIISSDKSKRNSDAQTVLSMEWNEIERQFMHDDFFAFINDGNKAYDTRTDLLFNHLVRSKGVNDKDDDFAYRWFQEKYDNSDSILDIWENDVKKIYDMLMQWYSDPEMYNYIGFLSQCGVKIDAIRDTLALAKKRRIDDGGQWQKKDNIKELQALVAKQFPNIKINDSELNYPKAIDELDYNSTPMAIRRVLLLFNIIAYSNLRQRFPFDRYVDEVWDIEHMDSQTDNPLQKNQDQYNWIKYSQEIINELDASDPDVASLRQEIEDCLAEGIESRQWSDRYRKLKDKIWGLKYFRTENAVVDKDAIGNLTLLDSSTNRGYGNSLFPYKRKCIVDRERSGEFVPACTRNAFLKYYSGDKGTAGNSSIKWSEDDARAYLKAIHDAVDHIFS